MPNYLLDNKWINCPPPKRHSAETEELWNKIRVRICETGLNLLCYFKALDPDGSGLVTESQFIDIILHKCHQLPVSVKEAEMLVYEFGLCDGCGVVIDYRNFLDAVEGDLRYPPTRSKNLYFSKCLSTKEKERLNTLLAEISNFLRKREVCIQPFLEDYDMIAKNKGTITVTHFFRLINQLGIKLQTEDFRLICKRFLSHGYNVNYIEFVKSLENVQEFVDICQVPNEMIGSLPAKLEKCNFYEKYRPKGEFLPQYAFHTAFNKAKEDKDFIELIQRIKRHIFENRIRTKEFFMDFDPLRSGFITKSQFKRCLDSIGLSKLHRLVITPQEVLCLCCTFANPRDSEQIYWMEFVKEIDTVFTISQLDKKPHQEVYQPPPEIGLIKKEGLKECVPNEQQRFCCETVCKIRGIIEQRRIYLEPFFKMFDKLNTCHVTPAQMRQVFTSNCFPLVEKEFAALELKYRDHIGFNYMWFLKESDPVEFVTKHKLIPTPMFHYGIPEKVCTHFNLIMCKIKNQVIRKRLTLLDFLKEHDRKMERCILECDFRRGLDNSGISLTVPEVDEICRNFPSCIRPGTIDYRRFIVHIQQPDTHTIFEVSEPGHMTNNDGPLNNLNDQERSKVSCALHKLCRFPDIVSNLSSLFQDYDQTNIGTITVHQFMRALKTRNLIDYLSEEEVKLVCKCFCFERGLRCEVDYRAFLTIMDTLFETVVI